MKNSNITLAKIFSFPILLSVVLLVYCYPAYYAIKTNAFKECGDPVEWGLYLGGFFLLAGMPNGLTNTGKPLLMFIGVMYSLVNLAALFWPLIYLFAWSYNELYYFCFPVREEGVVEEVAN